MNMTKPADTDCRKCGAPMTPLQFSAGRTTFDLAPMTVTAYRCAHCGHWNNLKRRKPHK